MHILWHGTASVEIISGSDRILFDPFVPLPGSGVPVKIEDFDGFTDIFVTHGHIDHISNLPEIVRRNPSVRIYCTSTPRATLIRKGVSSQNIVLLEHGDTVKTGNFTVNVLHGKHALLPGFSLSRLSYILKSPARANIPYIVKEHLTCAENDETLFYRITAEGKTVCLMGSLNLRNDVDYPTGADLLVLPYNGWEDNYPPAIRTIRRLRPKRVVLDHYDDTFPQSQCQSICSPYCSKLPQRSGSRGQGLIARRKRPQRSTRSQQDKDRFLFVANPNRYPDLWEEFRP